MTAHVQSSPQPQTAPSPTSNENGAGAGAGLSFGWNLLRGMMGHDAQTESLSAGAGGIGAQQDNLRPRVRVTASMLNVRSSPVVAGNNRIGQLSGGTVTEVYEDARGWLRIEFEGNDRAYISSRYTEPLPDATPAQTSPGPNPNGPAEIDVEGAGAAGAQANPADGLPRVRVTASGLNVRSAPVVNAQNRIGQLRGGDIVEVHGETDGWLSISFEGRTGFISGRYTAPVEGATTAPPSTAPANGGSSADAELPAQEAAAPGAEPEAATEQPQALPRVRVTASTLNVRSSPEVAANNLVGQLSGGAEVEVHAETDGWLRIQFEGNTAYISGRHTAPANGQGGAQAGGVEDEQVRDANERFGSIVSQLVSDYQNVPVWNRGQAMTEPPAATFRTPYVLNAPQSVANALAGQRNTHQGLTTRSGRRVSQDTGNRPFIGKGTPGECQIIAQAAIDAGLTTAAGVQAYVNNGPMNSTGSRRNGRWGVDCSGLTAIATAEMAGGARSVAGNMRSTEYRPGGAAFNAGHRQVRGDDALAGDIISYMSTNHVVVVFERQDTTIPHTQNGERRNAVRLRVGEASGSGIRSNQAFWYVPGAVRYGTRNARTAPDVTLMTRNDDGANQPRWAQGNNGVHVSGNGFNNNNYSIVRPPANQTAIDNAAAQRAAQNAGT